MSIAPRRHSASILAAAAAVALAGSADAQCALKQIRLADATATWTQDCAWWWSPAYVIDDSPFTAWALGDCYSGLDETRGETLVFHTAQDAVITTPSRLRFTMHSGQYHPCCGGGMTTVGRFRISVTRDARASFADGRAFSGAVDANWTVLTPDLAAAWPASPDGRVIDGDSPDLTIAADASVIASGPNPEYAIYTVEADAPFVGVTGVRVEFIDGNQTEAQIDQYGLGTGGPGRHANGNLILRSFAVEAESNPSITQQPEDRLVCTRGSTTLRVATDAGTATFQWRRNGSAIAGATLPTLNVSDNGEWSDASYDCVVTTPCGQIASRPARVVVCPAEFNCDGFLDATDMSEFIEAFDAGEERGDFNRDGFLDFLDFSDFIASFEEGC